MCKYVRFIDLPKDSHPNLTIFPEQMCYEVVVHERETQVALTPVKRRVGRASEEVKTPVPAPAVALAAPKLAAVPANAPKDVDAAKAAAAGPWKNAWLTSPLGNPAVRDPTDTSVALASFHTLPDMVARLESDRQVLGKYLVSKGVLKPEDIPMDKKKEDKDDGNSFFLKFV